MNYKGHLFIAAVAFWALAILTGAQAQSAYVDFDWQRDNHAIASEDFYYSGHYGYREDRYDRDNLFDIPGKVIGGIAGLLDGVVGEVFDDGRYYGRYYGYNRYYGRGYESDRRYYSDRSYDSDRGYRRYDNDRRDYSDRRYDNNYTYRNDLRYDSGLIYGNDYRYYTRARDYSDYDYRNARGNYYGNAYYSSRYNDGYESDPYNERRSYYGAYDDDD